MLTGDKLVEHTLVYTGQLRAARDIAKEKALSPPRRQAGKGGGRLTIQPRLQSSTSTLTSQLGWLLPQAGERKPVAARVCTMPHAIVSSTSMLCLSPAFVVCLSARAFMSNPSTHSCKDVSSLSSGRKEDIRAVSSPSSWTPPRTRRFPSVSNSDFPRIFLLVLEALTQWRGFSDSRGCRWSSSTKPCYKVDEGPVHCEKSLGRRKRISYGRGVSQGERLPVAGGLALNKPSG